jgi:hypothetical protein
MSNKRLFTTLAAFSTFTSSIFGSDSDGGFPPIKYEPVQMKGAAGEYNKDKHMSHKDRVKRKKKTLTTKSKVKGLKIKRRK